MPPAGGAVAPADAAAPVAAGGPQAQQPQNNFLMMVLRMGLMWYMMNWMKGGQGGAGKAPAEMAKPIWQKGDLLDVHVYLSEQAFLQNRSAADLVWHEADVALGVSPDRSKSIVYAPSEVGGEMARCLRCGACALCARSARVPAGCALDSVTP